ncbi:hypothetical protein AQUCO_02600298v1 [Aquilegia coerulea]|uniref:Uncharacterized protein n=1 Tax=Aquilegia coerulea TaxID=218851 RepID=A0A2G5D8B1_AQUCA|nr:hypothetical protein AQUCO_02600298v1 [Aquilegia coerulea]
MNHCVFQQNALAACEEMKNSVSSISSDRKQDCVVCPKPRRLGVLNHSLNDPIRTLRWQLSHQTELNDSKAGNELMEIILSKGGNGNGTEHSSSATQVASSPPFFCGSPPSRATNPLIQDARFGEEKNFTPLSPLSIHTSSPSSSMRKGGCVRAKFGHKPAPVRVEGFDCLDRDRRNCSIPAVA